jgi:hypothetical protein
MRKSYGTSKSVDDLLSIRGVDPKAPQKNAQYPSVGEPAYTHPASPNATRANLHKTKKHCLQDISPTGA